MSAARALRPRALRPQLSNRYQHLRRHESTAANTGPTYTPPAPPPPPPSFLKRYRFRIACSALALTFGFVGGGLVSHTLAPPLMPEPGTREDHILIADLNKRIDEDFKVKVLRGKCLGVTKQLKGAEGGWVEIVPPPPEDARIVGESLVNHMQGAKGLGVERLFWDRGEQSLVAVIWFGGSLCGWPGVTHGGAIATVLSEKLSLAASLAEGRDSQVSAAAIPQRMPGTGSHAKMFAPANKPDEPAQLSLSYVKPTLANGFYVVRVQPAMDLAQDPAKIVPSEPKGGHEYEATLETLDARICVKAKARFEASSVLQRTGDNVAEAAKSTYTDFKEWMWPSRQQSSSQMA
ncbi:hypothetical protein B0A50_07727 [Salinomyces thailandicus]|uniref:Thioesterase domain-containing protein n=1 Tax=Salinomyces thailandicus TaxID=706561 RepID=A0A4U0TLV7_9PEZI|nr:hypothetical protein B0A50_07727 [Salinomyces thailandica]